MVGRVIEMFIPNNDLNMIGFKLQIDDEIVEIIQKQNIINASIYKNDLVNISYDNKNNVIIERVLLDE